MRQPTTGHASTPERSKTSQIINPQDRQHHKRHDTSQISKNHEQLMNHKDSEEPEAHKGKDESKPTNQLLNSHPAWNQHSPAVGNRP